MHLEATEAEDDDVIHIFSPLNTTTVGKFIIQRTLNCSTETTPKMTLSLISLQKVTQSSLLLRKWVFLLLIPKGLNYFRSGSHLSVMASQKRYDY